MIKYLIDTFKFNGSMNILVLRKIKGMPEPDEAVRLFSHLINSQNKWMARLLEDPRSHEMHWFDPVYEISELESKWNESISLWKNLLEKSTEQEIKREIHFIADNGGHFSAELKDIALQLNYHSIHHRAQICTMLRKQNIEPPFIEYIGTVRKQC
jgi:uncharacterized damage-inducible protein DinB